MQDFFSRLWSGFGNLIDHLKRGALVSGTIWASPSSAQASGSNENPILLVHGIHDSAMSMTSMARWLERNGREVHTLSLTPNNGTAGLEELAAQVAAYATAAFPGNGKIDLVGFSMGGIVCRYYLQRLNGINKVERFVTISAPNNGTWWAYLSKRRGCIQMRPGSDFLRDLNNDVAQLHGMRVSCLWTPFDLMIFPATSSRIAAGKAITKWVVAHPLMILWPGCLRTISDLLGE